MKDVPIPLAVVLILGTATAWANDTGRGNLAAARDHIGVVTAANGEDGGNGLSDGMPGCGGGTNPASDGKFYIRATKKECNLGEQDRKKLKRG